jgi:hypothetical protein
VDILCHRWRWNVNDTYTASTPGQVNLLEQEQLLCRLSDILRCHIRLPDAALTDHDFVCAVHMRYLEQRGDYLLNPSE